MGGASEDNVWNRNCCVNERCVSAGVRHSQFDVARPNFCRNLFQRRGIKIGSYHGEAVDVSNDIRELGSDPRVERRYEPHVVATWHTRRTWDSLPHLSQIRAPKSSRVIVSEWIQCSCVR